MADHRHDSDERDLQLPAIQTWTQAQMDYWEDYVSQLADLLRLQHIELYFEWGKSLEIGTGAQSSPQLSRNRLRLCWAEDLPNEPLEDQRDTAVHELLHYHTARLRQVMDVVQQQLHKDVFATLANVIVGIEEELVETLTRIVAPNLPLPSWPQEPP